MDVIYSCEVLIVGGLIAHGLKHFSQLVFSIKVFGLKMTVIYDIVSRAFLKLDIETWLLFYWSFIMITIIHNSGLEIILIGTYILTNVTGLKIHEIDLAMIYTDRFLLHVCRVTTSLIIMVTVIWLYTNKIDHLIKFSNLIIITNAIYGKYSCFMFQWFV